MRQSITNLTIKDSEKRLVASVQLRRSANFRKLIECVFRYSRFCTLAVRVEGSLDLAQGSVSQQAKMFRGCLSEQGLSFLKEAEVACREITQRSEWPGTVLLNGTAFIFRYELTPQFKTLFLNSTDGLNSWLHPNFPEDPAFYRADSSLLLGSISHEEDVFLELKDGEMDAFSWVADNAANL